MCDSCETEVRHSSKGEDRKYTEYYKSGEHTKNVKKAREKAEIVHQENLRKRINFYNEDPSLCKECGIIIDYNHRHNKFCCKSCAASYNNVKRSDESRDKQRKSLLKTLGVDENKPKKEKVKKIKVGKFESDFIPKFCKLFEITCKICKKNMLVNCKKKYRKTCGADDCKIQASIGERTYQNGSRKPVYYHNKWQQKDVLLDSSWEVEVAQYLDLHNIEWHRPKFIKWTDSNNITRRYFPDFLLIKTGVYLDPKNPYCMEQDKDKIKRIRDLGHTVIIGFVKHIITEINLLYNI